MDIGIELDPLGFITGHSANQKMTEHANADRKWQKELARTGMQMRAKDLEAAGFNPILAYSSGMGAAHASGGGIPSLKAPGHSAVTSNPLIRGQADLVKAQAQNLRADTAAKIAGLPKPGAEVAELEGRTGVHAQTIKKLVAETAGAWSSAYRNSAEREKLEAELGEIASRIKDLDASAGLKGEQTNTELSHQIALQASAFLSRMSGQEKRGMLESLWKIASNDALRGSLDMKRHENASNAEYSMWKQVFSPYLSDMSAIAGATGTAWLLQRIMQGPKQASTIQVVVPPTKK